MLTLVAATYGNADVLLQVQVMIESGANAIIAHNDYFGDPQPGIPKQLSLTFSRGEENFIETCQENEYIFVSPAIRIRAARYIANQPPHDEFVDVTQRVQAILKAGTSILYVLNLVLVDQDPFPNIVKQLTIEFEDGHHETQDEQKAIIFPIRTRRLYLPPGDFLISALPPNGEDNLDRFTFQQGAYGNCMLLALLSGLRYRENFRAWLNDLIRRENEDWILRIRPNWNQRSPERHDMIIHEPFVVNGVTSTSDALPSREIYARLIEKAVSMVFDRYRHAADSLFNHHHAWFFLTGGSHFNVWLDRKIWADVQPLINNDEFVIIANCYEKAADQGLDSNHVYAVLGTETTQNQTGDVTLVRIRNPHGAGSAHTYRGNWSSHSALWNADEKLRLEVDNQRGVFFLSDEEFLRLFRFIGVHTFNHPGSANIIRRGDIYNCLQCQDELPQ